MLLKAKPAYPYRSPEKNNVVDSWFCSNKKNATDSTPPRTSDLCAYYSFSDSFMCKVRIVLVLRISFYVNKCLQIIFCAGVREPIEDQQ